MSVEIKGYLSVMKTTQTVQVFLDTMSSIGKVTMQELTPKDGKILLNAEKNSMNSLLVVGNDPKGVPQDVFIKGAAEVCVEGQNLHINAEGVNHIKVKNLEGNEAKDNVLKAKDCDAVIVEDARYVSLEGIKDEVEARKNVFLKVADSLTAKVTSLWNTGESVSGVGYLHSVGTKVTELGPDINRYAFTGPDRTLLKEGKLI